MSLDTPAGISAPGNAENSSRAIIYASNEQNFAEAAAKAAQEIQQQMSMYLAKYVR